MALKLKTVEVDGTTYAAIKDGKPLYEDDSGKEVAFDVTHATQKIKDLNDENKEIREKAEAAEALAKNFEGLDAAKARKALETVSALDQKQLVDAGKVEEIRAAAIRATEESMQNALKAKEEEIQKANAERDGLMTSLHNELIGGNFARSSFIGEKLTLPSDIAQATFGRHFKVENGKVVAYAGDGKEKIYSKSRPGELASFDEALEMIVDSYPHRDSILKGLGQRGAGSAGEGAGSGGNRRISRAEFERLPQADRRKAVSEGAEIVD